jgi:hypothetical protein
MSGKKNACDSWRLHEGGWYHEASSLSAFLVSLRNPRPRIAEGHGPVEDQGFSGRIHRVRTEIAGPFELESAPGRCARQARLYAARFENIERLGVQMLCKISLFCERIGYAEKAVVKTHLCRQRMGL